MGPNYVYLYLRAMQDEAMVATFAYFRLADRARRLRELLSATASLFTDDGDDDAELLAAVGHPAMLERNDVEEDLNAAIETFLSAQARLSLFLAPSPVGKMRGRAETRAAVLRERLGLQTEGQCGDRDLRNAWMHIDENIDAVVFERSADADLIVRHLGSVSAGRERIVKLIDPEALSVTLLGAKYALPPIYDWIDDISRRLSRQLQLLEAELQPEP